MADDSENTWAVGWKERIMERIRSLGCNTIADFLGMFPSESYFAIAARLGQDVTAFQIQFIQFEEAERSKTVRQAAKDSLVRTFNEANRKGWRVGMHWKRRHAHVFSGWIAAANDKKHRIEKDLVWQAIEQADPPLGWLPANAYDNIIQRAFDIGWPET